MSGALNSVFGGGSPIGSVLSLATSVASVAFPQGALLGAAVNLIADAAGQALNQAARGLTQEAGMPKFIADIVGDVVKGVLDQLEQPCDKCASDAVRDQLGGDIRDFVDDFAKMIQDNVRDQMGADGEEGGKCGKGGGKGGSWLQAIASAMGAAAGKKAGDLVSLSEKIHELGSTKGNDPQLAADHTQAMTEFQAASQEFSMLQSAFSTAIKSLGEGLGQMARKS